MSDDKSRYRRDELRLPSPPCLTPRRLYSPVRPTVHSLIDATPDELNSPSWLAGTVRTSRVGDLGMVSGVSAAGLGAESLGAVHDGVGVATAVNADNSQVKTSCAQMSRLAEARPERCGGQNRPDTVVADDSKRRATPTIKLCSFDGSQVG